MAWHGMAWHGMAWHVQSGPFHVLCGKKYASSAGGVSDKKLQLCVQKIPPSAICNISASLPRSSILILMMLNMLEVVIYLICVMLESL